VLCAPVNLFIFLQAIGKGGWQFAVSRFLATPTPEVKFWCLQMLCTTVTAQPAALSPEQRMELKNAVMGALVSAHIKDQPPFVVNKFCLLIVLLAKQVSLN
jgi:hypothetical protein